MKVIMRRSQIFKFEAARYGVRLYLFENHITLQFDFHRKVSEIIFYKVSKNND
jgi:hypothetical protein